MPIDFRSDTVTRPTAAMKEAMFAAPLGDDVFGDDPSINALEEKVAKLFGMEAALFCSSGTLANQLAIKTHTQPGENVICHKDAHIFLYEGGGIAANAFCSVTLLDGPRGLITADALKNAIEPDNIHHAKQSLVSLENTMNKGGGACYDFAEIQRIADLCKENKLKLHLDGARLFNALVESKESPADYGRVFDSISICLSKGLGCPVGSVLVGKKDFISAARKQRKTWGGGWRQAGLLAAAGIYALDEHVERLKEDHRRAQEIGQTLENLPYVAGVLPIETNIIIFELKDSVSPNGFVMELAKHKILAVTFGKKAVRFVTHLDINDHHIVELKRVLSQLDFA
ncbi:aminotransferase class I/II-fold pyridoxal phosphate-dependent enzyme [Marinilongibacter aquaticus]|uniref:threonine aldolase family protein n=1 Tax=Marinilongibacter aquaticus TaxID=2975157 RepID=UPI0021BD8700|nr:GntG family PLP-dependent aldolase [Marinilongibacter aquaticus]UBM59874.1 aminotransferase class I/II-fold pyridoxal phosphate-dependent enzyme [Marinilongibacter aquaticus]